MATAVQKIASLGERRDIPFNKLVLSQSNVRRVKAGVSIEEMAESIARRGLIQSLHVRPVLDADGAETGMFEVPAGGRRYRALELLVKQKRLAKTATVPCVIGDANSDILVDGSEVYTFTSTISGSGTITFGSGSTTLAVNGNALTQVIHGFGVGDAVDLKTVAATGVGSYANGVLTLTDAGGAVVGTHFDQELDGSRSSPE